MLTPEYYYYCTDEIVELYSKLDESITRDIARRIVKAGYVTEGAKWQIGVEREAGLLYDDIVEKVAEYSNASEEAVKAIFEDAGITSTEYDNAIYRAAGKEPQPLLLSKPMMNVLNAGVIKTHGLIDNLTMTTALSSQNAFINACSLAEMEISSGAFEYNTAIRNAVSKAIEDGNRVVYASGAERTIEAAVRTAVMTGVSQTTGEISLANARELGTDLMRITAHGGARPDHAKWQGQLVSLSGKRGYLSLKSIGYGEVTGFKGANCRHDWYPHIKGISSNPYTKKYLNELNNKTVTYNGKEMSLYDAQQKQRAMERQMRDERRQLVAYDDLREMVKSDEDKEFYQSKFDLLSTKLKRHESVYKDFSKQTGLKTQAHRIQTNRYNRSVSQKAVHSDKKLFEAAKSVIPTEKMPKTIEEFNRICYNPNNEFLNTLSALSYDEATKVNALFTDRVVRSWYIHHDKQIINLIDKSLPLEEQAEQAFELRNKYKTQARDLMLNQEDRKLLDEQEPIITFEQLIEHKKRKGLSGDDIYRDIIDSSSKTRKTVNKKYGLE